MNNAGRSQWQSVTATNQVASLVIKRVANLTIGKSCPTNLAPQIPTNPVPQIPTNPIQEKLGLLCSPVHSTKINLLMPVTDIKFVKCLQELYKFTRRTSHFPLFHRYNNSPFSSGISQTKKNVLERHGKNTHISQTYVCS